MGLRADSARRLSLRAEPPTRWGRAESARNPIAVHVKFGDDCANAQPGLSQWTAAFSLGARAFPVVWPWIWPSRKDPMSKWTWFLESGGQTAPIWPFWMKSVTDTESVAVAVANFTDILNAKYWRFRSTYPVDSTYSNKGSAWFNSNSTHIPDFDGRLKSDPTHLSQSRRQISLARPLSRAQPCLANTRGPTATYLTIRTNIILTRAPLGYFYNAPHWGGGGGLFRPPSDLRNYWTDSKNSSDILKPWKNCRRKTNFIDLGATSDVTGQVKVKMFDISGLVTSASKIAILSTNKAN